MSELERNKILIRQFVDAINVRDWQTLTQLMAADFCRHSHAAGQPEVRTRDEFIEYLRKEFATFPDAEESLEDMIAEGDKVAVRHRCIGTQKGCLGPYPASGKTLKADYLAIYRIADQQIVEAWAEWDNLTGLKQLGHVSSSLMSAVSESTSATVRSPKAIIKAWVEAFNRADVEALGSFYHEDAINHQVADAPCYGQAAIQDKFAQEFATTEMTCIVENIFEDGDWAMLEWSDPRGLRGCGCFHLVDGKIKLQRGYWDQLSCLRQQGLPLPVD